MDLRLILLLPLLSGCGAADRLFLGGSENDAGLGTHSYSIAPDGTVDVNVRSLYGGPAISMTTNGDGTKTMSITPADRIQLEKVLRVLAAP